MESKRNSHPLVLSDIHFSDQHNNDIYQNHFETVYRSEEASLLNMDSTFSFKKSEPIFSSTQEKYLFFLIVNHFPEKFGFKNSVWSDEIIQQLIYMEFNIKISLQSVHRHLRRWKILEHNSLRAAYEKTPALIKKWLIEEYSLITLNAKKQNASIHWINQSKTYPFPALDLSNPIENSLHTSFNHKKIKVTYSLSQKKELHFVINKNASNCSLIYLFSNLIASSLNKIFIILDKVHDKNTLTWLNLNEKYIEAFYLPTV